MDSWGVPAPSSAMAAASALAMVGEAHFFEEAMDPLQVRRFLEDPSGRERLKGMKWLLAMISKGRDVSDFFPAVVKNVVARGVEVKKMVYIYLVHYADHSPACRELALLSINSFQKDLAASNQLIRALALRVMTSIRVADILQIQLLAVRKCAGDISPYVRKCAANALPKIHQVGPEQLPALQRLIAQLLRDASTMVLGSAVAAFTAICPDDFDLLHTSFRKLCHLLADCDEWAQILILKTLVRYLRANFCDPSPGMQRRADENARAIADAPLHAVLRETAPPPAALEDLDTGNGGGAGPASLDAAVASPRAPVMLPPRPKRTVTRRVVKKAFYSDEEDESDEEEVVISSPSALAAPAFTANPGDPTQSILTSDLDPDHRLALRSALPLLKSRNAGVVLGVASLFAACAPHFGAGEADATAKKIAKALVRHLRSHREIQFVMLTAIRDLAASQPALFLEHLRDFYVKAGDPSFSRVLKLEILTLLLIPDNASELLRELGSYVRQGDAPHGRPGPATSLPFVVAAVKAVGRVAERQPEVTDRCVAGLVTMLRAARSPAVVDATAEVLRVVLLQARHWSGLGDAVRLVLKLFLAGLEAQAAGEELPGSLAWTAHEGARAAATGLVAEAEDLLSTSAAPTAHPNPKDLLRCLARTFPAEGGVLKMQLLLLAAKLSLRFPEDARLQTLGTYVLELGRYDVDYDIRDRARFLAALLGFAPAGQAEANAAALLALGSHARDLLLPPATAPSLYGGLTQVPHAQAWAIGSLSSVVGHRVEGYDALPDWPQVQPDVTVRDREDPPAAAPGSMHTDLFYAAEDDDSGDSSYDSSGSSSSGSAGSNTTSSGSSGSSGSSDSETGEDDSGSESGLESSEGSAVGDAEESEDDDAEDEGSSEDSSDEGGDSMLPAAGAENGEPRAPPPAAAAGHAGAVASADAGGIDLLGRGAAAAAPPDLSSVFAGLSVTDGSGPPPTAAAPVDPHAGYSDMDQVENPLGATVEDPVDVDAAATEASHQHPLLGVLRSILKPEAGGGVSVAAAAVRDPFAMDLHTQPGLSQALLRSATARLYLLELCNQRPDGEVVRRLRLFRGSSGRAEVLEVPSGEVGQLGTGGVARVGVVVDPGHATSAEAKLELQTERGKFPVTLGLLFEDLVRPDVRVPRFLALRDEEREAYFEEERARRSGFHDQSLRMDMPEAAPLARFAFRAQRAVGLGFVMRRGERIGLHAQLPGPEPGMLYVEVERDDDAVSLRVSCDDAMKVGPLAQTLKAAILDSGLDGEDASLGLAPAAS